MDELGLLDVDDVDVPLTLAEGLLEDLEVVLVRGTITTLGGIA